MKRNFFLENVQVKINKLSDNSWEKLFFDHLRQALKLYDIAQKENDKTYYRDCISRANKVFEGVVKLVLSSSFKSLYLEFLVIKWKMYCSCNLIVFSIFKIFSFKFLSFTFFSKLDSKCHYPTNRKY